MSSEELSGVLGHGPEQAARLAEAAAKLGVVEAQLVWAQMLLEGLGVEQDAAAAFRWFRAAAESGEPHALNMLGRCYERGWGIAADYAEASRLYAKAAEKGDAWAQFNLAAILRSCGDLPQALSMYVRAARQGLGKAMTQIGEMIEMEKPRAAARWYARGAARGDFRAHAALARMALKRGDIASALRHLEPAVEGAFPAFCGQMALDLLDHPHEQVRALGERAATRAAEKSAPPPLPPRPRKPRKRRWRRVLSLS